MICLRTNPLSELFSTMTIVIAVASLALAGCGGSGSSGFDDTPGSEPEAIREASEQGACIDFGGILFCASGAPVVVDDDSAVIEFDEPSGPLPCAALPDEPACTTSVGFLPDGFPPETTYLGAWAESDDGPWTLVSTEAMAPDGDGDPASDHRDVVVLLPDASGSRPNAVVIAVLVYLGSLPTDLPAVSTRLRGFAPDFVYVTSDVSVDAVVWSSSPPAGHVRLR